jgi:hypothetical protein
MGRVCSSNGDEEECIQVIGGHARRRRWVDNIKMDLREIGWGGMDWIVVAQDMDKEGPGEQGNESSGSIKCWEVLE